MNTALLLSGGTGSRIMEDIPKQYIRICGKMLVTRALEPLLASPVIDRVVIVAERTWQEAILEDARKAESAAEKISGFALPGRNRQSSVLNGLSVIMGLPKGRTEEEEADTVLIHDAARPFLTGSLIRNCYGALGAHDGVIPVLPMKDTLYRSQSGKRVDGLLERGCIYAGQAPELFLLEKYDQANRALLSDRILEISGSAEAAVLAGMDIVMIPGEECNFKITTKEDLFRAKENLERGAAF